MVDFVDYLKSSLSSGEVKLLFAADQFRKSPGMPPTRPLQIRQKTHLTCGKHCMIHNVIFALFRF